MVKINEDKIPALIDQVKAQIGESNLAYDKWSDWHIKEPKNFTVEQVTTFCFVVDAMNFCFWPDNPSGVFEYEHITKNLEALLIKDPQFFTCERLLQVDEEFLNKHVFTTEKPFCLVNERARIVNEVASVI